MDLSTTYLGFKLPHPLMPGASPMVDDLGVVRQLEDAGAAAIVMHSLFEEQLNREDLATTRTYQATQGLNAEATDSYLPDINFRLGPDEYLEHVAKVKAAVSCPVFGSLNGTTAGGWLKYAKLIEDAGADGLELNVYFLATDLKDSSAAIEKRTLDMARAVKESVRIPVAMKLSPFYTSTAHFAAELVKLGIDGLVLFNRFYQSDIDVENLDVKRVNFSNSSELLLRLRWLAVLSGRVDASLACTGGVHTSLDAIKSIMAGADAVQMVAAILQNGPRHLQEVREGIERWMEHHEYESLQQMRGSMNLLRCPDPKAYERANYMQILQSWRG